MDARLIEVREKEEAPCGASEGGPSRARTGDLIPARDALSQLSYGPAELRQCSSELEITSPANARSLAVPTRRQTQADRCAPDGELGRQEKAGVHLRAVSRDYVDLSGLVLTVDESLSTSPTTSRTDFDRGAEINRPLALHAKQVRYEIEDQVVTSAFDCRTVDVIPELERGLGN